MGEQWYAMQGIEVVQTDRGGKVTYHGPGQLVGYPIVRVEDVVAYVRTLEETLVAALAAEGVSASPAPTTAPTSRACGSRRSARSPRSASTSQRGVTTHGFAVNVENDLQPFSWIVPCGLDDVQMTSLIRETRRLAGQMPCFRRRAAFELAAALGLRQRLISRARLEAAIAPGRVAPTTRPPVSAR